MSATCAGSLTIASAKPRALPRAFSANDSTPSGGSVTFVGMIMTRHGARMLWNSPSLCRFPVASMKRIAAYSSSATAAVCAAASDFAPVLTRSSIASSEAREYGSPSAVAWTSTRRPSPVITALRSTSADESSS